MSQRTRGRRGPTLTIDNEVTRRIRQHARSHMKTEVCGVLIGAMDEGNVQVRASIEAVNAAQAGTHVIFTQDAWEAIYKVKDQSYPEERIVGWYHSHPGFGVFLSEHDMFIHENFFSSPNQVAWVYDPHTDEEGCFGWIDGGLHRIPAIAVADNNGDGAEHSPKEAASSFDETDDDEPVRIRSAPQRREPSPWMRRSVTALSYLSVLLLGFMICWFLFPHLIGIPVDPRTGTPIELEQLRQEQQSPPEARPTPGANPSAGARPESRKPQ
jgi:proteasome lid subunit RPN8/RPN11